MNESNEDKKQDPRWMKKTLRDRLLGTHRCCTNESCRELVSVLDHAEYMDEVHLKIQRAYTLMKNDPQGCPKCDSGILREGCDDHWAACGFRLLDEALGVGQHE